jgi:NADPH:quinone reductase-like Zn-dependent oxidoreductase
MHGSKRRGTGGCDNTSEEIDLVKAAFFKEHGGAEHILYDDYRDPVAQAGEVVVRVKACALNQADMLLLDGGERGGGRPAG